MRAEQSLPPALINDRVHFFTVILNLIQDPFVYRDVTMSSSRSYFTYMMASPARVLYVGVTADLERRVWQHKNAVTNGFANRYGCTKLVWFGETSDVSAAIGEEKRLKHWRRQWKVDLIEQDNPRWHDLASAWGLSDPESSSG